MELLEELKKDIRYLEGLTSCINCGVCTAICPGCTFFLDRWQYVIAEMGVQHTVKTDMEYRF